MIENPIGTLNQTSDSFFYTFVSNTSVGLFAILLVVFVYINRKRLEFIKDKIDEKRRMRVYEKHLSETVKTHKSEYFSHDEIKENYQVIYSIVSTSLGGFTEANNNLVSTLGKRIDTASYNRIRIDIGKNKLKNRFK